MTVVLTPADGVSGDVWAQQGEHGKEKMVRGESLRWCWYFSGTKRWGGGALSGANLGGGRRHCSGHGDARRARGGKWVGTGGAWDGESGKEVERGLGGGLK